MNIEDLSSRLPARLAGLAGLAANLWWSWHLPARDMFDKIDRRLWRTSGHNPVRLLYETDTARLEALAGDPGFLRIYDAVMAEYQAEMTSAGTWADRRFPGFQAPVAYFSMEFAVHNALPIYAGGLGVLAGDICKEASDLGIPLAGVGFMYPEGYFHQRVTEEGWQAEDYLTLDFARAPVSRVSDSSGEPLIIGLMLGDRNIDLAVWEVRVGRVRLFLLDTNVLSNSVEDRSLSARLYSPGKEIRFQQEYVLGVGGVRVFRSLGIEPGVWHCNEGHTAFLTLERLREYVENGVTWSEAVEKVRDSTVFTTHTPVPAGHDIFDAELIDRYFGQSWREYQRYREEILGLGTDREQGYFNMSLLGLKAAGRVNGVSRLHGEVSRSMWRDLYPANSQTAVPIGHITNGVHIPTWISPEMGRLFAEYIARDWQDRLDEAELWRDRISAIPDGQLWQAHQSRKLRLLHYIRERVRRDWTRREASGTRLAAVGALLDPEVLTIGFVRRFVEYKRPTLLFRDIDKLKRIIGDAQRPVQFVFAGKSHPADYMAKELIHRVYQQACDPAFEGRVCFVEDYDLHLAHYMVQGVDVWLNNPRRLLEASGTSGMKAAVNGVPNLSVRDGWWYEGFTGTNGWAIGDVAKPETVDEEDALDAEALYYVLKELVAPMYYDRNLDDIPARWLDVVRKSISSVLPGFSATRMMKEYAEKMYRPAD